MRKTESENVLRESGTLADQKNLLMEVAGSLRKQSLMMSIARWQDLITYIMYVVFVLHAFVVAFGVAGELPDSSNASMATDDSPVSNTEPWWHLRMYGYRPTVELSIQDSKRDTYQLICHYKTENVRYRVDIAGTWSLLIFVIGWSWLIIK